MALLTLTQRLLEAEEAQHALLMGRAVVSVSDSDGSKIEYRAGSARQLAAYVIELRKLIGGRASPSTYIINPVSRRN